MKVGIAADNTIPLHIPKFIEFISSHSKSILVKQINLSLHFKEETIDYYKEIAKLSGILKNESASCDIILLLTAIPLENNYFYVGLNKLIIVSFSDWHLLTSLPITNGLAYMLCQIIIKQNNIGTIHEINTGCINDFLWDKTGIDVAMRAAFICDKCKNHSAENKYILSDEFNEINSILNSISVASRKGMNILLEPASIVIATTAIQKAVFLCHNSQDKLQVRLLNETLKSGGVITRLDEERIPPGSLWQDELEKEISSIGACLIIVGDSGFGPWQDMERRVFINEFASRGRKIIPVLIGSPASVPLLPLFLRQFMWSDLRANDAKQLARLLLALK